MEGTADQRQKKPPTSRGKRKGRQSTDTNFEPPGTKRSKPKSRSTSRRLANAEAVPETSASEDDFSKNSMPSLYDAVAGRVGYEGFLLNKGKNPLPPDQVLFRSADAPLRYQEDDIYFANRHLPPGQRLPESDLLKAIHAYTSDFYGSGQLGSCRSDFASLDETALLAMGILLEEAAAQSLGETGDLAFVEARQRDDEP